MTRIDCCDSIIHFTKGKTKPLDYEDSYKIFKKIIKDGQINCGSGMIKGNHCCVCFTEAPIHCLLDNGKLNDKYFSRYSPFGFEFQKKYIYGLGGRHVTYSHHDEYEEENLQSNWRHVTYNPTNTSYSDWTWEREWRLNGVRLILDPNHVKLVFPNMYWIDRFMDDHEKQLHGECQECKCKKEATIFNYSDYHNSVKSETIKGTCPVPTKFPWILINMNQKSAQQKENIFNFFLKKI